MTDKPEPQNLTAMVLRPDVQKRFSDMLGERSSAFLSSVLSLYNATPQLQSCDPKSILSATAMAATLELPINRNLGFAAIVPYKTEAQFQIMAKGFVQLGLRSGQYRTMNVSEVYKDEIASWNPLTGVFESTPTETWKLRDAGDQKNIVGYLSYFKLHNGFEKHLYWTVVQVRAHGKKYSKSFDNPQGQWLQNFHAMALKTLIKAILSKWGILSPQMERAIEVDQAVIKDDETISYPDRPEEIAVASKPNGAGRTINDAEFRLLCARADDCGFTEDAVKTWIKKEFGKEHRKELNVEELTKTIKWIEQEPQPDLIKEK